MASELKLTIDFEDISTSLFGSNALFLTGASVVEVSERLKFLGPNLMVFVVSSVLQDPDYRCALENLKQSGCQFGSHSVSHRKLTSLTYADQVIELRRSKEDLEDFLNRPITKFRAPGFYYNTDTLRALDVTNYKLNWSRIPGRVDKSTQNWPSRNVNSSVVEMVVDSMMGVPIGGGYLRHIKKVSPKLAQYLLRTFCCYCHPWEFADLSKLKGDIDLPPKFFVETGPDLLNFYENALRR